MEKDMIFFSKDGQGLTSTSANHIANLAKEMIRGLEASLGSLTLYSTAVSLIGSETSDVLTQGAQTEELRDVQRKLHAISKAKSLIAWLREAIKAKESLLNEATAMTNSEYIKLKGLEEIKKPEEGHALTEDEYYASLTLDARNRYYELETLSAVLGKAIHPDGSFANAREMLNTRLRQPREVKGDGRDTLIYSYSPTVEPQDVEDLYFRLQKQYREAQSQLNAMKFDCQKAVKSSEVAVATEYARELEKFTEYYQNISAERAAYIKKRVREIGDYKILIPQSLQEIYNEVSHLGKK
ncbi:MAG: hypothetical protein K2I18_09825 [Paramuribaculum sp.]|nr:hypothetical protein [Paramuribaculum sp.]